jgi:hypothetical protein
MDKGDRWGTVSEVKGPISLVYAPETASFAPILRSPQVSILDVRVATPAVKTLVRPCLGTKATVSGHTLVELKK